MSRQKMEPVSLCNMYLHQFTFTSGLEISDKRSCINFVTFGAVLCISENVLCAKIKRIKFKNKL